MESDSLFLRLLSDSMADDDESYQRRQGFWLRMSRERAGKSQQGAAEFLGLSAKSKSTISDYENGATPVPVNTLRRLAAWYGVPLRALTEPETTAFDRLDELARDVAALALQDFETGEAIGPAVAPAQGASRGRPSPRTKLLSLPGKRGQ